MYLKVTGSYAWRIHYETKGFAWADYSHAKGCSVFLQRQDSVTLLNLPSSPEWFIILSCGSLMFIYHPTMPFLWTQGKTWLEGLVLLADLSFPGRVDLTVSWSKRWKPPFCFLFSRSNTGWSRRFPGRVDPTAGWSQSFSGRVNLTAGWSRSFPGRVDPMAGWSKSFSGRVDLVACRPRSFSGRMDPMAGWSRLIQEMGATFLSL